MVEVRRVQMAPGPSGLYRNHLPDLPMVQRCRDGDVGYTHTHIPAWATCGCLGKWIGVGSYICLSLSVEVPTSYYTRRPRPITGPITP